jgi:hypothetical protein
MERGTTVIKIVACLQKCRVRMITGQNRIDISVNLKIVRFIFTYLGHYEEWFKKYKTN